MASKHRSRTLYTHLCRGSCKTEAPKHQSHFRAALVWNCSNPFSASHNFNWLGWTWPPHLIHPSFLTRDQFRLHGCIWSPISISNDEGTPPLTEAEASNNTVFIVPCKEDSEMTQHITREIEMKCFCLSKTQKPFCLSSYISRRKRLTFGCKLILRWTIWTAMLYQA